MDLPLEIVAAVGEAQCLGKNVLIVCCNTISARNLFVDIVSSYGFTEMDAVQLLLPKALKVDFDKGSLKICSAQDDTITYRSGVYKIRFADQWDSSISKQRRNEWMEARYLYSRDS